MKVAFPYIAQAHQIPHSFPIAAELAEQRLDYDVRIACCTAGQEALVRRLLALYPSSRLSLDRLRVGPLARLYQYLSGDGQPPKVLVLLSNRRYFRGCDAIVVPERTSLLLRKLWLPKLRMIWTNHGAPGRAVTYARDLDRFDYVLLAGERQAARMRSEGTLREDRYHTGCYAKFDLVARLAACRRRLFDNARPTVLYNPHFSAELSSWPRDGFAVLDHFAASRDWNLIFAPHVRLFDRRNDAVSARLDAFRSVSHMLIDTGSDASIDMTYTQAADLYLGDVSSQIAEFMVQPRACVFINSHATAWEQSPDYLFWHLGPVIEHVDQLGAALRQALAEREPWHARQQQYFRDTFDAEPDAVNATAGAGAKAIAAFLERPC